jgi:hypothetical protein
MHFRSWYSTPRRFYLSKFCRVSLSWRMCYIFRQTGDKFLLRESRDPMRTGHPFLLPSSPRITVIPAGGLFLLATCSHTGFLLADFRPWRWRWYLPPKRRFTQDLHGATSQKTSFFIVTSGKTSNLTGCCWVWNSKQTRITRNQMAPSTPLLLTSSVIF